MLSLQGNASTMTIGADIQIPSVPGQDLHDIHIAALSF